MDEDTAWVMTFALQRLEEQPLIIVLGLVAGCFVGLAGEKRAISLAYIKVVVVWIVAIGFVALVMVTWNERSSFSWIGGTLSAVIIGFVFPFAAGWIVALPAVLVARAVISLRKKPN
jgi:hypothetical protein